MAASGWLALFGLLLAAPALAQAPPSPAPTTVQQDLQILFSDAGHDITGPAFIRLLDRGPAVAAELEAALDSPAADDWDRVELLDLLGEVGDAGSVSRVATLAHDENTSFAVRKAAFRALSRLPPDPAAATAAEAVLDAPRSNERIKAAALFYLSERPTPRASVLARRYRSASNPHLRAGALSLAASVGEPWAPADISDFLAERKSDSSEELLLRRLAKTASPQELAIRVPPGLRSTDAYRDAETLARANAAQGSAKVEPCEALLRSESALDRRDAIACIVEQGRSDLLEPLVQPDADPRIAAAVRNELRRLGQRTVQRGTRVTIEHGTP